MNPLTNIKNIQKLNETELKLGIIGKKSWHDEYKDSAWIFIGGLPYDLSEGDVICVFSQYGEIVNMNLVRDHKTGKSKGFGFLCFQDQRSTVLSVDNLNGIKILGRTIRVDHVKDYKVPNEHKEDDQLVLKMREEGCAPKLESDKEEEAEEADVKEEPVKEETARKKKKGKKEKKKKKKKKSERKRKDSGSSSESSSGDGSESDADASTRLKVKTEIKQEPPDTGYHGRHHPTPSTSSQGGNFTDRNRRLQPGDGERDGRRNERREDRKYSDRDQGRSESFASSKRSTRDDSRERDRGYAGKSNRGRSRSRERERSRSRERNRSRSRDRERRFVDGRKQDEDRRSNRRDEDRFDGRDRDSQRHRESRRERDDGYR